MQLLPILYGAAEVVAITLQIKGRFRAAFFTVAAAGVGVIVFLLYGQEYHTKVGPVPLSLINLVACIGWMVVLFQLIKVSEAE